jgi:hypothetical protein
MPLEGAYLYCNKKLEAKPTAHLNDENDAPFAIVSLDAAWSGTYIRVHSADVALTYMQAFFKAWRLLNPDGPLDALMAELLDEPDLAKIRARILEEEAPGCGAEHAMPGGSVRCTKLEGHDGQHLAGGSTGEVYATWPQDVQVCFWCGIEGTGMRQISVVPEGLRWECADAETCRHGNAAFAAPDTAQPEDIPDDGTGCPECGVTDLPRREDGRCRNGAGCRERQAAKASAR